MAALNKKHLAAIYGIDPRVLNKHYENWKDQIGPYVGRQWTPKQIETWHRLFGMEAMEPVKKS